MLNLDELPQVPPFEVQWQGQVQKIDAARVSLQFEIANLDPKDPDSLQHLVGGVLGREVDFFTAQAFQHEFNNFCDEHLYPALKKVFGPLPTSPEPTASVGPNTPE